MCFLSRRWHSFVPKEVPAHSQACRDRWKQPGHCQDHGPSSCFSSLELVAKGASHFLRESKKLKNIKKAQGSEGQINQGDDPF